MGVVREAEGRLSEAITLYARIVALDSPERAVDSTDKSQQGETLAEVAKKNLTRILTAHPLLENEGVMQDLQNSKAEKEPEPEPLGEYDE